MRPGVVIPEHGGTRFASLLSLLQAPPTGHPVRSLHCPCVPGSSPLGCAMRQRGPVVCALVLQCPVLSFFQPSFWLVVLGVTSQTKYLHSIVHSRSVPGGPEMWWKMSVHLSPWPEARVALGTVH